MEEWLPYLHAVSNKLGLRHEKHLYDEKLVKFLMKKRKSDRVEDQVVILDIFNPILPHIFDLYEEKLRSKSDDEFDTNVIVKGMPTEDGMFYEKYFLPCCLFLMYQEWLKFNDCQGGDSMADLFTIGSGSATIYLIPEVHGLCLKCAPQVGGRFVCMNSSEISKFNEIVFKRQKNDNFMNRIMRNMHEYSNSSEDEMNCNPFDSDVDEISVGDRYQYNPFESSASDNDNNFNLDGFDCSHCFQSFPGEEFLSLHMKIFHSNKLIQPVFVSDGEELMKTFVHEESQTPKPNITGKSKPKQKAPKNDLPSSKQGTSNYKLRRRLNM